MEQIKKSIKNELVNGLDNVFELLGNVLLPNSKHFNTYILLRGRFRRTAKNVQLDLLKYEDFKLEESQIAFAVISLVDELRISDFKPEYIKQNEKNKMFENIGKNFNNYRDPLEKTERIVLDFNQLNLVVGECIEIAVHPNLRLPLRIEEYGWNPLDEKEISLRYKDASFSIGQLKSEFKIDPELALPNGRKYSLSNLSGALIDEPPLSLEVKHSDFFTIKSLLNQYNSNLPEELISEYASLNPGDSKIPHSLCMHNFIFLDDGNILCQLRSKNLSYHKGKFSFSQEEQLSDKDFQSDSSPVAHLMMRGLCEEIFPLSGNNQKVYKNFKTYLEPILDTMKVWSIFVESNIFNYSFLGFTKLNISIDEYKQMYKNFLTTGIVDNEGTMYYTQIDSIENLLKIDSCEIIGVFNNKTISITKDNLHPTSLYRIYKFLVQLNRV